MFKFKKFRKPPLTADYDRYQEILEPPAAFDGYLVADDDPVKLRQIGAILSAGQATAEMLDVSDRYNFVDSLIFAGYVTADLQQDYSLEEIVGEIKKVAANLHYDIELSKQMVLAADDDDRRQARALFGNLTFSDLNVCAVLLAQQGYELFQVFLDCGGYPLSLLPSAKIAELRQYTG